MLNVELKHNENRFGTIEIQVTNISREPVKLLKFGTILDEFPNDVFQFFKSEFLVELEYVGPTAKRAFDESTAYVTMKPNEVKSVQFDLFSNYRFECDGEYEVALKDTELSGQQVKANTAALAVTNETVQKQRNPSFFLDVTLDDCASDHQIDNSVASKCPPTFVGCPPPSHGNNKDGFCIAYLWTTYPPFHTSFSSAQIKKIKDLYRFLINKTNRHTVANNAAYQKWFGAYTYPNFNTVRSMIYGIHGGRVCKMFTLYNWSSSCTNTTIAWYRPSPDPSKYRDLINFCPAFWSLPDKGIDSKIGTIAHEISHKRGTKDYVYDYNACLNLAKTDPAKAINNANNYEYYIEEYVAT